MAKSHYKYKPEYCEQLIDHMGSGLSFDSFGAVIKVATSTIYKWVEDFPEFKEAKDIATAASLMWYEKRFVIKSSGQKIKGIDAKEIDSKCLMFAMRTRFHKTYSEKREIEHKGNVFSIDYIKKQDAS